MDKQHVVARLHTMENHCTLYRREILTPAATWVILEDIMLSQYVNPTEQQRLRDCTDTSYTE